MFAKKEKARIAELEADLNEEESRNRDRQKAFIAELKDQHAAAKAQQDADALSLGRLMQDYEARIAELGRTHGLFVAHLEGVIEALKDKGAKYDQIVLPWQWHSGGAVEIEGKSYRLMEARIDNPLANFRLPVPEGMTL